MKRVWLLFCYVSLTCTLLLWVWLFLQHTSAAWISAPAGVLYLGLSLFRIVVQPTWLERWHAFQQTCQVAFASLIILLMNQILLFYASSTPFLQGVTNFVFWMLTICIVLLCILRVPSIERWLNTLVVRGRSP